MKTTEVSTCVFTKRKKIPMNDRLAINNMNSTCIVQAQVKTSMVLSLVEVLAVISKTALFVRMLTSAIQTVRQLDCSVVRDVVDRRS